MISVREDLKRCKHYWFIDWLALIRIIQLALALALNYDTHTDTDIDTYTNEAFLLALLRMNSVDWIVAVLSGLSLGLHFLATESPYLLSNVVRLPCYRQVIQPPYRLKLNWRLTLIQRLETSTENRTQNTRNRPSANDHKEQSLPDSHSYAPQSHKSPYTDTYKSPSPALDPPSAS